MSDDWPSLRATIRNAVIHIANEQPLLADLYALPTPTDVGLLCTNLRTLGGKRPVFADHVESTFFFPYSFIRFVEIHPGSDAATAAEPAAAEEPAPPSVADDEELEIDEDFLRRIREV